MTVTLALDTSTVVEAALVVDGAVAAAGRVDDARAHAEELGIDPDRIAVMGYSAGAHLASLVGLAANHPELVPDCALLSEATEEQRAALGLGAHLQHAGHRLAVLRRRCGHAAVPHPQPVRACRHAGQARRRHRPERQAGRRHHRRTQRLTRCASSGG